MNHESRITLVADGTPIYPRIRAAVTDTIANYDGLRAAPGLHLPHLPDDMAAGSELGDRVRREPGFQPQLERRGQAGGIGRGKAKPPRSLNRLLHRQSTIYNVA